MALAACRRAVSMTERMSGRALRIMGLSFDPGWMHRIGDQKAFEATLQGGLVGSQGGVLEPRPSSPDGAGALELALQAGRQHHVAGLAGVLDVADQVGEADLMSPAGPTSLRAEAVGGLERGPARDVP
ncbi:hypothetical protein DK412_04815 [Methylobacterium sp. 17Sr1-1]|nr:hypothetical protein DK412_04815 [Methylobacterium sp. 17Sr1-1]